MVHYKTVLDIRGFKGEPKMYCTEMKMYILFRKMTIYGHFSIYKPIHFCLEKKQKCNDLWSLFVLRF